MKASTTLAVSAAAWSWTSSTISYSPGSFGAGNSSTWESGRPRPAAASAFGGAPATCAPPTLRTLNPAATLGPPSPEKNSRYGDCAGRLDHQLGVYHERPHRVANLLVGDAHEFVDEGVDMSKRNLADMLDQQPIGNGGGPIEGDRPARPDGMTHRARLNRLDADDSALRRMLLDPSGDAAQ